MLSVLALLCIAGEAKGVEEGSTLLLAVPPFESISPEEQFQAVAALVDELFRGVQFTSLVGRGRGVESTPSQFTATLDCEFESSASSNGFTATTTSSLTGNIARDVAAGMALSGAYYSSVAPESQVDVTLALVMNSEGIYNVKNDICSENPPQNVTLYGHVLSMPSTGQQPCPAETGVDDSCEVLSFSSNGLDAFAYVYTLDDGSDTVVPLVVNVTMEIDSEGVYFSNSVAIYFSNYDTSVVLDPSEFDMPDECNRAFYESCDALAEPATMQFYLQSTEPLTAVDLSDLPAGDVYAAAADLCPFSFVTSLNQTSGYIVRVSAVVDKNFDMMHAQNAEGRVQHSGALFYGDGDFAGQCSDNEGIGNWFFFPADGQCGEGEAVGDNPCYWEAAFNVTSIPVSCFVESGIQGLCVEDYQLPFAPAAARIEAVFADPSDDACAPIVATSPPAVADDDGGDNGDGQDEGDDDLQDGGWYWLAAVLTAGCIGLVVVVIVLALVAYKFKDRLMEIPVFAVLAREPQPGGDYDSTQWKTLSEGGSNGLLDGDLIDDDDLDLTFD